MIFSKDEAAQVQAEKQTAKLVAATSRIRPDRVTALRRRFQRHDEDGKPLDWVTEQVVDVSPGGERRPVVLTVLDVREVTIDKLDQKDAKACGFRTVTGLREAWRARYPSTFTAKLVHFTVGDVRDVNQYLAHPSGTSGDYTEQRHLAFDDLPTLRRDQLAPITKLAREQDRLRGQHPEQILRDGLMRQLEEYELAERKPSRHVSSAIRAIRHQVRSLDRRLNEVA